MEISSSELKEKINNGEKVIVDFHATWCGPCKMMKPTFERLTNENTTEVGMYTMDVDLNRDLAIELGIRSVPTIKIYKGGKEVFSRPGVMTPGEVLSLLD